MSAKCGARLTLRGPAREPVHSYNNPHRPPALPIGRSAHEREMRRPTTHFAARPQASALLVSPCRS